MCHGKLGPVASCGRRGIIMSPFELIADITVCLLWLISSWRYQYLMVVEVAMAQDEALRAALANIYQTDSTDKLK